MSSIALTTIESCRLSLGTVVARNTTINDSEASRSPCHIAAIETGKSYEFEFCSLDTKKCVV